MKVSTLDKICCFLAELIGTGLLVLLGCMGCIETETFPNSLLQKAFNFGLVVMVIIQCFGTVSGAHLNPAVTAAAYVYNLLDLTKAIIYFVAQMLGALIGYGLLKTLVPKSTVVIENAKHNLCVATPHPDVSTMQGFTIEFIITMVLVVVCCAVWDPRNSKNLDSVSIRVGLTVSSLSFTAAPFTCAGMNPARAFAPAMWNNDFTDHWIYWCAPLSAAVISSFVYKTVFWREVPEDPVAN